MSWIEKSRTRKTGDRIAQLKAQPRATASSWLRVYERVLLLKNLLMRSFSAGTRVQPPTISTESMSSGFSLASARACSSGTVTRSKRSLTSVSRSSRFIILETSMSFMSDSTLIGADALADRTFFIFSAAVVTLTVALGFEYMSILFFSLNWAAKESTIALSKFRPPKCRSCAVALTASSPFLNSTTEQV